jgi:hypothetical protein
VGAAREKEESTSPPTSVEVDLSRLKTGHYVVTVDLSDGRRAERRIEIIRFAGAT